MFDIIEIIRTLILLVLIIRIYDHDMVNPIIVLEFIYLALFLVLLIIKMY